MNPLTPWESGRAEQEALRDEFQRHLEGLGRARHYIKCLRSNLRSFFAFLQARGIHALADVTSVNLDHYQASLIESRQYSPHTVESKANAVRVFFKFLYQAGYIARNPCDLLRLPRRSYSLPRDILSEQEVTRLLDTPNTETPAGIRDRAIMETFYSAGLRLSELINLTIQCVDTARGTVRVNNGKNGKDRIVPVGRTACFWIRLYRQTVRPKLVKSPSESSLFVGMQSGRRIDKDVVYGLVKKYGRMAGIRKRVFPHILRHSFASHLLANGASTRSVQEMLGHELMETTEIYTRVNATALKEMHRRFHPREQDEG